MHSNNIHPAIRWWVTPKLPREHIFIPPNNLGFVFPIEVGERFTGSNNSVYFTFRPTGSFTNKVYWYALFVRD